MGVLQDIQQGILAFREFTERRETYAQFRQIIYEKGAGRLDKENVFKDLILTNPKEYYPSSGEMVFFEYYPKYVEKLSIYDRFPLVYVFGPTNTVEIGTYAFFGANLHYINKSKVGGIRNRQYASNTIIRAFEPEELFEEDYKMLMQDLNYIVTEQVYFGKKRPNLYSHPGSSLYHKYIRSYFLSGMYVVPEEYTNIMLFLELENFITK